MLDRIKQSFNEGVRQVKWFAAFLSERTKAETSMARMLYESSKLEGKLDVLYRDLGKRVLELKDKEDKPVFKDFIVLHSISEIQSIKREIEDCRNRARELGRPPDIKPEE